MFLIEETVLTARAKASKLLAQHDSVIITVDFKNGTVHDVLPVVTNENGEWQNEFAVRSELKRVNCQPRKINKRASLSAV